ncbi:MAG TPA: hypothetical protein DD417_14555 [Elusimicrobia bacterium]|nr:MAG: hypothetical protein A2X53_16770 [Candidatus Rokubacteria bacterium GWA2_70_23]HAM55482.1 hypothetical protein [Candidatus Rokubacteria bacterium]HBL17930.1 hypothetical protein [Elusimicrobiota bacterium]
MSPHELIERAEETYRGVYQGALKDELERTAWGKFLIINVDTGEHLLADTRAEALRQFRARFPYAPSYVLRVGVLPVVA